ncbi:hypothetical protein V9T40_006963 [Parthenolecanium corni]|uniref:DUF7043 domain-containing protein n=1 Tax=Parthenolecanium corni TaxID=536013 RepID=A0AAN9YBQ0_9HEMI
MLDNYLSTTLDDGFSILSWWEIFVRLPNISFVMHKITMDPSHHQSADCKFPYWITDHHTWHLLDHSKTYHFSAHNGTLKVMSTIDGETKLEMRAVCNMILESSENKAMISAHITTGCDSGYRCMSFYRRDGHVIEIQQSNKEVQIAEEACTIQNFNQQTLPFITLVSK